MASIVIKSRTPFPCGEILSVTANGEGGEKLSSGIFTLTETSYGKDTVKTMLAGGIETPVVNRRGGSVRAMFEYMHKEGGKEGAAVALLHPFAFSFYRKFGYERVADHVIIGTPLPQIDFVPRRCNFVPYDEAKLPDMIKIYNAFGRNRNLLLPRYDGSRYTGDGKSAYIYYENGEPAAYVVLSGSKTLYVNNYINTRLTVNELAYVSPSALCEVFSFLRMFEGEYDRVEFRDGSLCPEVDMMLREYARADYKIIPDLQARVLNTERMLKSASYPEKEGGFIVKVNDGLPTVNGVFRVEYGGGDCGVTRLDDDADFDISLPVGVFTQILYGYGGYNENNVSYANGVTTRRICPDLFRAFPPRPCGAFEHF